MPTTLPFQTGLWFDHLDGLPAGVHAALAQAGVAVQAQQELQRVPGPQTPVWLAVRLGSADDLQGWLQALQAQGVTHPWIARVPRHQMPLAMACVRAGAAHVLPDDETSGTAWREALQVCHSGRATATPPAADCTDTSANAPDSAAPAASAPEPAASPRQSPAAALRQAVFVDPQSQHLLALAQRVGQAGVTALIEGPTGAGKEVLARVLHESSVRARGPFVALNCATLPETLIDDMLFGHEKGAFTGAQGLHRGLFEQAQGGTLFLDEIGEMPLHLQAKLLRVLQERQLTRLGSERAIGLDVRVIAATNRDLREAIARKEFREDLYFRISTFKLRLSPLAQRPGDVLPLAACIWQTLQPQAPLHLHPQAQALLLQYPWPGNVRELENVMQRAAVLCPQGLLGPEHLMFDTPWSALPAAHSPADAAGADVASPWPAMAPSAGAMPMAPLAQWPGQAATHSGAARLPDAVRQSEHQLILAAIEATSSRLEAARKLGISPRTLRYKLAKLKAQPLALTGS